MLDFDNRNGITKCKNYVWYKIAIITSALEIYSCELPTTSNQVHGMQKIYPSDPLRGVFAIMVQEQQTVKEQGI